MSEKLTQRDEFGNADIIGVDSSGFLLNLEFEELNLVTTVLNKLADYEDTGVEPEEVSTLKDELDATKSAICEMCRKRGEEQHILCACVSCKYGGSHDDNR